MKKFTSLLIAVIMIILSVTVIAAEVQTLAVNNGNFSAGLKGWSFRETENVTAEVTSYGDTEYCLKIVDNSKTAAAVVSSASINVPEEMIYANFSLRFKSKTPAGSIPVAIGVRVFDGTDTQLHTGTKRVGALDGSGDELEYKTLNFSPADIALAEGRTSTEIKKLKIVIFTVSTDEGVLSYIGDISLTCGGEPEKVASGIITEGPLPVGPVVKDSDFISEKLNALTPKTPESLGAPIAETQILGNYIHIREDGDTIFYAVTAGPPAIFFAYNIDKNIIEARHELQSESGAYRAMVSYCVMMDSKGIISIATQSDCMYFRYNPKTDEMKSYGKVFSETAVMSIGYFDESDNFYFGTYPNAKLIKYDIAVDKLVDLGTMIPGHAYVRAMTGYKEKIYMGSIGNPTTPWVKYDIKAKQKTNLEMPKLEGVFTSDEVENFYVVNTAGKYIFAKCKIGGSVQGYYLCVFDTETEKWIDYIKGTFHLQTTDLEGDLIYIHKLNDATGIAVLHSYNVKTKELTPFPNLPHGGYIVNPKLVTLKDQNKYPGKTLVGGANMDGLILMNFEKGEVSFIKDIFPKQTTQIRILKAGYGNDLLISAYMGSKFVIVDTVTKRNKTEGPSVQVEGFGVMNDLYYFGLYGKGRLSKYNPNKPVIANENPRIVSDLAVELQDREFVVTSGEGEEVIWGGVPDYGKLGGAIGIYDPKTDKARKYANVVPNQSIGGLVYKNGKIYGSTHIYGGLGIDPVDDSAKLFIMDYATGKVEKTVDIKLTTDTNKQYFCGFINFGPDGYLWAGAAKTVIKIDPETLKILDEIPIGNLNLTVKNSRYIPFCMDWDKNGLLYTNVGYQMSVIDTETKEVKRLLYQGTNSMSLDEKGDVYFVDRNLNYIGKIPMSEGTASDSRVSLFIDKPEAYVNGVKKPLDPENPSVAAKIVSDRTLVPVRFLSENFGLTVGWEDDTQTVTLSSDGRETKIVIGEKEINVGGQSIATDVPAMIIEGRTMLPLRAFCENVLGKTVFWDERGLIVISEAAAFDPVKDKAEIDDLVSLFK